jgi:hypothetical protein
VLSGSHYWHGLARLVRLTDIEDGDEAHEHEYGCGDDSIPAEGLHAPAALGGSPGLSLTVYSALTPDLLVRNVQLWAFRGLRLLSSLLCGLLVLILILDLLLLLFLGGRLPA